MYEWKYALAREGVSTVTCNLGETAKLWEVITLSSFQIPLRTSTRKSHDQKKKKSVSDHYTAKTHNYATSDPK